MHAIAFNALRSAPRPTSRIACRIISGSRYPLSRRNFRSSTAFQERPKDSNGPEVTEQTGSGEERKLSVTPVEGKGVEPAAVDNLVPTSQSAEPGSDNAPDITGTGLEEATVETKEEVEDDGGPNGGTGPRKARIATRTLSRAKARRLPSEPEGLPPANVPDAFLLDNVLLYEEAGLTDLIRVEKQPSDSKFPGTSETLLQDLEPIFSHGSKRVDAWRNSLKEDQSQIHQKAEAKEIRTGSEEANASPTTLEGSVNNNDKLEPVQTEPKYEISNPLFEEIIATVSTGLMLRPPQAASDAPIRRPLPVLDCPLENSATFLDAVVQVAAKYAGCDLITLEAQDFSDIVGPYVDENLAWAPSKLSLLGYDVHGIFGKLKDHEHATLPKLSLESEMNTDSEDMTSSLLPSLDEILDKVRNRKRNIFMTNFEPKHHSKDNGRTEVLKRVDVFGMLNNSSGPHASQSDEDQWKRMKINKMLEKLINAAERKRSLAKMDGEVSKVMIQIKDYKALIESEGGNEILGFLQTAVDKQWRKGKNVVLLGTTCSEFTKQFMGEVVASQSDISEGVKRTVIVVPTYNSELDSSLEKHEKLRTRQTNVRHIEDMIKAMVVGTKAISIKTDIEKNPKNRLALAVLQESVWSYARVYRLVATLLGIESKNLLSGDTQILLDGPTFERAYRVVEYSDRAKVKFNFEKHKSIKHELETVRKSLGLKTLKDNQDVLQEKVDALGRLCNTHEKKLLGGIVMPSNISTTFDQVHAPEETVQALKTLTTLSLKRPDAFSYGILASNKIPGVLLYGPPGTGKTLLARAVAKESGAIVLEISGAELNGMYVGESEKNAKAVFSLAKKLSPCVVFIDEADAILASRQGDRQRGSHRETINQFLKEWDGMKDTTAFIMVATNRPYDMDDAVMRRLPRRLLVDLPLEEDRCSILKIHLRDEILDDSVSLAQIAKDTPFYSGSDLKNVSVAAALACIREENAEAAKHTGEEPYVYPEKRILKKSHFETALNEISASISDDMGSLKQIRKFDERYGDRRGRRKKSARLGFGGTTTPELDSEAARVRTSR